MIFFLIAIVVIIVGVVLWVKKGKQEKKLSVIDEYEDSTIKMIRENYDFIEGGYGEGNFSHFVEVKGYAAHGEPLIAEFSGLECVYYHSKVVEEYETEQAYRDQNGRTRYRWVRNSRVVQDTTQKINFDLDDDSGLIYIDLEGAELNTQSVYNEYEQGTNPDFRSRVNKRSGSSFLDALMNNVGGSRGRSSGTRILGYKYTEEAIPLDAKLYVIGEANDRGGELTITKSKEEGKPFIVSMRSEEQITGALKKKINMFKIGAIACFVIGLAIAVFGAMYSPSHSNHTNDINNYPESPTNYYDNNDEENGYDNDYW